MEYSLLGYEDQKLYFEFKLLDGVTRLEMPGMVEMDDSTWHNVTVTREGNFAVLQVDYNGRVSSNTGGAKKLLKAGSSKLYIGGMPNFAPKANSSTVNKVVEAAVTDHRYRRSMGKSLNLTTDNRLVSSVSGDMTGCIASIFYNGKNLDADTNVRKVWFNTKPGCPCYQILSCRNGSTCVSGHIPYCQCPHGSSGKTCENIGNDGYKPSDLAMSFIPSASSKPEQKSLTIWAFVLIFALAYLSKF